MLRQKTTPEQAKLILNSQPQVSYALMDLMVKINAVNMEVFQVLWPSPFISYLGLTRPYRKRSRPLDHPSRLRPFLQSRFQSRLFPQDLHTLSNNSSSNSNSNNIQDTLLILVHLRIQISQPKDTLSTIHNNLRHHELRYRPA